MVARERERGEAWGTAVAPGLVLVVLPLAMHPGLFDAFMLPKLTALLLAPGLFVLAGAFVPGQLPRSWPFRLALSGVVVAELVALGSSLDVAGSRFGAFGYRLGFVPQMCLLVVFAGTAAFIRGEREAVVVLRAGAVGLVVAWLYAMLQAFDADPFSWRTVEGAGAFSTLGNANYLAEYALLAAAFVGAGPALTTWKGRGAAAAILALVTTSVAAAQSRTGIVGLAVVLVALPLLATVNRRPRAEVRSLTGVCAAVAAAGLVFAVATGEAATLQRRFGTALDGASSTAAGLEARSGIWRGALASFGENPWTGVGQDALISDFNRHRPADLGPPFSRPSPAGADPLVASPHMAPLEVLVSLGLVGAVAVTALAGVVGWSAWRVLRRGPSRVMPGIVAGTLGFAVVAMANPLALPALAVLAVFAGMTVGLAAGPTGGRQRYRRGRALLLVPGVLLASVTAVIALPLLTGDRAAYEAARLASAGDVRAAAEKAADAGSAGRYDPVYLRQAIRARIALAIATRDQRQLERAYAQQQALLDRYRGLAVDYLALARLRLALGRDGVEEALDEAHRASPHGIDTAREIAAIRATMLPR